MAETTVDRVIDLRDEVCPYTFVKSKVALEQLDSGRLLEVHLGNSELASNVPRSIDLEGHEVASVDKPEAGHWIVTVRRS